MRRSAQAFEDEASIGAPDASDATVRNSAGADGSPEATATFRRQSLPAALREVWSERRLFRGVAAQGVALRPPRWVLGAWWYPIIILFNLLGATFIFGGVLDVTSGSGIPYFLFACAGMTVWWFFYRGAIFSMRSFHLARRVVSGFSVPLLQVPFAGVVMGSLFGVFSLIILLLAIPVFWALDGELYLDLDPRLLIAPLAILWACSLAAIVGLWSGPIYWRVRDVRHMLRIVLPFILYVTPIVYPLSALEGTVGPVANLNPLAPPVELLRMAVFGTEAPPAYSIGAGLGLTVLLLAGGCWFTNRFGYTFISWQPDDLEDEEI